MKPRFKAWRTATVVLVIAALFIPGAQAMQPAGNIVAPFDDEESGFAPSGVYDFRAATFGTGLTECPQAGLPKDQPKPLDLREKDRVEQLGDNGNDRRANQDYSCLPQDETSIAVNPREPRNLVGGANDYRPGYGASGFYASTDNGTHWYDGVLPVPTLRSGEVFDGGGDPAVVFDRAGVVYYAGLGFNRTNDTNGVFVNRSTNGGFTWSRPCVPFGSATPATDQNAVCGGLGDPRQPGDGVVNFYQDDDGLLNGSVPTNDKEYIAAGPRPSGTAPTCFTPITRTPTACNPAVVGIDRLYVTWSIFSAAGSAQIYVSYSDDQARSWSSPKRINGSAAFCSPGGRANNECADNQGSTPTVSPVTGALYVSFINGDTEDEDQYVVVRSYDGGTTFQGPFFATPIFDVNYPRPVNGRADCAVRGQGSTRAVLTNSCFRVNSYGRLVVDRRGGAFADDLYLVIDDNRNGTIASSNVDVFFFKSNDGGTTWIGPTRVNDDPSTAPADRDCGRNTNSIRGDASKCPKNVYGNDQWFPWIDIGEQGDLNVVFHDRRLDLNSAGSEWPASRSRPGNYLAWFWGAQCRVTTPDSRECTAPTATVISQPGGPVNPGAGPVPGSSQSSFPFRNFTISDVPSNLDYSFRAGLFMGDYNNVAVSSRSDRGNADRSNADRGDAGSQAYAMWTDARNGRSSKDQAGRNPACEQSDVFVDSYGARNGGGADKAKGTDSLFLVTPCPSQAADKGNRGHGDDHGSHGDDHGSHGDNGHGRGGK